MKIFGKKAVSKISGQVGMSFKDHQLALAYVRGSKVSLKQVAVLNYPLELSQVLKPWSLAQKLEYADVVAVMPPGSYEIFLVDQPNVPAIDLHQALKWKVADYIDYGIDQAIIDYIELPPIESTSRVHKVYVICVPQKEVRLMADQIRKSKMRLRAIEVPETSLIHIAKQLEDNEQGFMFLNLGERLCHLILMKQHQAYMIRDMEVALDWLHDVSLSDGLKKQGQYERAVADLASEIQRTMDYCQGQYPNFNCTRLVLGYQEIQDESFLSTLSDHLGLPVRMMELDEVLDGNDCIPEGELGFLAVSAALRERADP